MSEIKAILFDMDGVLIDAREWHYDALNRALALFGMEIGRDEHLATFDGLPTRTKLGILSKSRGLPAKLHGFLNDLKQKYTAELAHKHCKPLYHHQYALARLKREGYRIAVCSNSIRRTVEMLMELSALKDYLDLMLSNENVSNPKPHPEIYETAMRTFGLTPAECLVVEDNEYGIRAAQASGAHVLIVNSVDDVTYDRVMEAIRKRG